MLKFKTEELISFVDPLDNATKVVITGNFDNWSKSVEMEKKGNIFLKNITVEIGTKLVFKFIINDEIWTTSDTYEVETDEFGNSNNILIAKEKVGVENCGEIGGDISVKTQGMNLNVSSPINFIETEEKVPGFIRMDDALNPEISAANHKEVVDNLPEKIQNGTSKEKSSTSALQAQINEDRKTANNEILEDESVTAPMEEVTASREHNVIKELKEFSLNEAVEGLKISQENQTSQADTSRLLEIDNSATLNKKKEEMETSVKNELQNPKKSGLKKSVSFKQVANEKKEESDILLPFTKYSRYLIYASAALIAVCINFYSNSK
ncbi:hypothetical protein HK099_003083 [Clydaea vesicula]|uniref:AMP-activated protein kinase glycogen-binding domain-containing protein n=1 Tax=Clydaea vesicula TaxID=447962 RepID=A0AAD5TX70_9FUNG|nr:hypothetical protein HK099_003083 [Clydaea vesicula]